MYPVMKRDSDLTPEKIAFGQRLKTAIRACGYETDSEFARDLGVDQRTLANWTNGWRWPEPMVLGRLSEKLQVTVDWLYYGRTAGLTLDAARRLGQTGS